MTSNRYEKRAVVSDIHGNIVALEKVVEDIESRNVELVVNLGDHLSGPLWPKETLDYLRQQNWIQICGNHERQMLTQKIEKQGASDRFAREQLNAEDMKWLQELPERVEIGKEIVMFHGSPGNDKMYLLEVIENGHPRLASRSKIRERLGNETARIILCGHTHIPRIVQISKKQVVVNPGSVGLPAYDDVEPEPHVMESGSPHARYAILEKDAGEWNIELVTIAYDYEKAVAQAKRNGRKDWAVGLRYGFMEV